MKVLIATGIYPPDIGGPATYSKIVAGELARRGHSVSIVTYSDGETSVTREPFLLARVSRATPKGFRHIVYFLKILKYGKDADILYALDTVSAGLPAKIAAFILRKPFALRVVGDYAWEQGVNRFGVADLLDDFLAKKYGFRITILRFIQDHVAKGARLVVVPSRYLQSVVLRWGVSESRIAIIPNSVHSVPMMAKEDARKKLGLDGFVLVSAGRLTSWKGFPMLVELMDELKNKGHFRLVILGDGPERNLLEGLIKRLDLEKSVLLLGAVSKEVLIDYLAAGDVFALNTGYEGFSHQILEAMISGIPAITTLAGGNKEIVEDGQNALVAGFNKKSEWHDAIVKLYQNPSLGKMLASNAGKLQHVYSVDRMVDGLIEQFKII